MRRSKPPYHLTMSGMHVAALALILAPWLFAGVAKIWRSHARGPKPGQRNAGAGARGTGKPKDRREFWSRRYRAGAAWTAGTVAVGPYGIGGIQFPAGDGDSGEDSEGGGDGDAVGGCGGGDGGGGCGGGCGGGGGGCGGGS